MPRAMTSAPRIVLAGSPSATAPLARDLVSRGLDPIGILGRTPGEGAEAAAHRPERLLPRHGAEALRGSEVVILAEAASWDPRLLEEIAAQAARAASEAAVIVSGEGSGRAALRFLSSSRLDPRRVLATGGLAVQLRLERSIALRAGVSRAQVSALIIGGEGPGFRPLRRSIRVAGIPAGVFLGGGDPAPHFDSIATGPPPVSAERGAAALLADAILRDRRRVLCCGSLALPGAGLREDFFTMPVSIGAGGVVGRLALGLTLEERAFLNRARD